MIFILHTVNADHPKALKQKVMPLSTCRSLQRDFQNQPWRDKAHGQQLSLPWPACHPMAHSQPHVLWVRNKQFMYPLGNQCLLKRGSHTPFKFCEWDLFKSMTTELEILEDTSKTQKNSPANYGPKQLAGFCKRNLATICNPHNELDCFNSSKY